MSKLAIQGGNPVRTQPWPQWPQRDKREEDAVLGVVRAGDWGGFPMPNTHARRFGDAFAQHHNCEFSQCVANGTVSLEIALQAMGVEPGAEVIVPAYTFEGTAAAALFAGCSPVFADVDPGTYCISPDAIEAKISPRTQAIIPVHLAMRFSDMDRIMAIAKKHKLAVLEDCAHAHGGRFNGKGAGSHGDAGSFSFQTSKLMTAGEGGIVITNDPKVMDGLYALTNCGRQRPGREADAPVIGHNYRMSDLQAAILEVQLTRLEEQHTHRNANIAILEAAIEGIEGLSNLAKDPRITTQAAYQFVFKYDAAAFDDLPRDAFVAALNAEGVPCDGQFYEALPSSPLLQMDAARYPAWARSGIDDDCPVAHRAGYEEAVWVSHHLFLGDKSDVEDIVTAIRKVIDNLDALRGFEHPSIASQGLSRVKRAEMEAKAARG